MERNTMTQQERDELHSKLWNLSNTLRGAVDGWDFKQYVLGTMFYRFISENLTNYINDTERDEDDDTFDFSRLSDNDITDEAKEDIVAEKGFFIYPSQLFTNVCKKIRTASGNVPDASELEINECKEYCRNLNVNIERIFREIEASAIGTDSEDAIKGLFSSFEVNSNNLGDTTIKRTKKLETILIGIENIEFGHLKEKGIDVFGDAYEYLMGMYASNAGKVGGEYFTPQQVAKLLAKLATEGKHDVKKVYDPACGSGSLLLQVAKCIGSENVRQGFFGQEINPTTYNLCRINMFLHDVGYDKFSIACEDTLLEPQHLDETPFDVIVSNPPYSIPWKGDADTTLINDPRFSPAGVLAPKNNSDFAFILHSLAWLSTTGTGAFVCFPGILYRDNAEQKIRKYLVDNNFVDAIIQLPPNMFFGVGIFTCIMILKKNKADNSVLFIDASTEFEKNGNKNNMTDLHINHVLDLYRSREEIEHVSHIASYEEISSEQNNYDLSVSTYVEKKDKREIIDIEAINKELSELESKNTLLRSKISDLLKGHLTVDGKELDINKLSLEYLVNTLCGKSIQYHRLSELGVFKGGLSGKDKNDFINGNKRFISYTNVYNNPSVRIDLDDKVLIQEGERQTTLRYGDIIFTGSSETPDDACMSSVLDVEPEEDIYLNSFCFILRLKEPVLTPRFARYLFRSYQVRKQLVKTARGVTRFNVSKEKMKYVTIPVPPIEVQDEITRILDLFTELNEGIQQEIVTRNKQYEFYLDAILK